MAESDYSIIVFGEYGVGKASIIKQLTLGSFCCPSFHEIEVNTSLKVDDIITSIKIIRAHYNLDFMQLWYQIIKMSDGFIVVYSMDCRKSFEIAEQWCVDIIKESKQSNPPIVVCGNKCDIKDNRAISQSEGEELASRFGAKFFEISAKDNININEAFSSLVRIMKNIPNKKSHNKKEEAEGATKGKKAK